MRLGSSFLTNFRERSFHVRSYSVSQILVVCEMSFKSKSNDKIAKHFNVIGYNGFALMKISDLDWFENECVTADKQAAVRRQFSYRCWDRISSTRLGSKVKREWISNPWIRSYLCICLIFWKWRKITNVVK